MGASLLWVALGVAAATSILGCTEELEPLSGTASLRIELQSPADPGSIDNRLPDAARQVTIAVSAIDTDGLLDETFSGEVDIYAHFLGGLTPDLGAEPLARTQLVGGVSPSITFNVPSAFGQTFLWVEHTSGDAPTYATGTSPSLWYREPNLVDISRPPNEDALDALERSPLENKQVQIGASRYGEGGRMVVTGVYAQGYTLSDAQCGAGGAAPCTAGDYDHVFVFTFNRPRGEGGETIVQGDFISRLTGAVSEFNGLTEVNFPQSFVEAGGSEGHIPAPVVIDPAWLDDPIAMERVEAALVAIDGAELCPLDEDFETFAQWKLALGGSCDRRDVINIITQGQVNDFIPADYVGQVMPRVVGTLRPVNIGTFNVWILYPRGSADIVLP